jgi:hypothetical protein
LFEHKILRQVSLSLKKAALLRSTKTKKEESHSLQLLIPAYFAPYGYGEKEWEKLIEVARTIPVIAIVNPASGPGKKTDPRYTEVFNQALEAGVRLIGYTTTAYGERPLSHVIEEIGRWYAFYPEVQGIFIDEQASSKEILDYYIQIRDCVRETIYQSLIVTNPGTSCDTEYLKNGIADVFCFFENKEGFESFSLPSVASGYPSEGLAALIYNARSVREMNSYINRAIQQKIGALYITDMTGVNPWDRLPSYWEEEVMRIQSLLRSLQ